MVNIREKIAIMCGKFSIYVSKMLKKNATALPGKVALSIDNGLLNSVNEKCGKIILITGTNGKTTTNNLLNHVIKGKTSNVLSNLRGANMIQGVASTYVKNPKDSYDYGVFEVDEGSLKNVTRYIKPDYIIINNFFRDQLDRYGEIDNLVEELYVAIEKLPNTTLVLNCDDPLVNKFKNLSNENITFGLDLDINETKNSSLDLKNCPICGGKLEYKSKTYGHFGDYECLDCSYKREKPDVLCTDIKEGPNSLEISISNFKFDKSDVIIRYPYNGIYNAYNALGVYTLSKELSFSDDEITSSMESFSFSLGRMEEMEYKNKIIKVILTKNPIGLTSVSNIISKDSRSKSIVHILNDNPADGEDISWIWDAYTVCEDKYDVLNYYCSGIRCEEIALKKKYDGVDLDKIKFDSNFKKIINQAIEDDVEIVYVLPTYTAIFETRDYIENIVSKRSDL